MTSPAEGDVFAAYNSTPLSNVRVVIVGQDPYPNSRNATGLAFSTGSRGPVTNALDAIYTNLASDPSFVAPNHGDLTKWASRGALLLNTALTLSPASLATRCALWGPMLGASLRAISQLDRPVPVILLGSRAFELRRWVTDPEAVKPTGHPTPRNRVARQFPLFEKSRPFYDANHYLVSRGEMPFDWSLA
ncbi:uracil-DNA glycosylase family protein [Plantibacter sp. CFBP 8798]|uniref:uracil-DNA glycosylase family protein n=1 Tax=Plantibacter sp. CFBP 8798 TaxID=2775268 RepID=UPI003F882888